MAGPGNILIRVGADAGQAIRELRSVNKPLSDVQSRGERMSAGVQRAAVPAAAALVALGYAGMKAAKAAAEDESAQTKLAGALERTAGATKTQIAGAESYITALSTSVGVADDELRPALAQLASATGDVETAQSRLKLALDISAQSGKPLATVTKALAGAEDGRTASLGKLVPGMDQAILKSKDMSAITGELNEKVGGAAAEAAGTAEGQYRVLQVRLGELQEGLGAALLPAIGLLVTALGKATAFATEHQTAAKILIGTFAALAGVIIAANVALKLHAAATTIATVAKKAAAAASKAWAFAQVLLNIALSANPIGLIVIAIAALVAGIVIAWRKSDAFRNAIKDLWQLFKLTPLGFVISLADDLVRSFDDVIAAIQDVIGWLGKIKVPSLGGVLSHVPGFLPAPGGAAARALRAGGPLGAGPLSASPRSLGSSSGGGSLGGAMITINVYGATDPEGTARTIRRTLRSFERRQGGLALVTAP